MVSFPRRSDGPESQDVPTVAHFGAFRVGSNTAVWAPPLEAFTVKLIVALWLSEPDVPVTVTVTVPVVAVAEAVKVRVELTLPFAGGVTGFVEKDAVTPEGRPEAARVVAELKLFWLVIVMLLVPLEPWVTLTEVGEAAIAKLG
jgi:hypothetical protein